MKEESDLDQIYQLLQKGEFQNPPMTAVCEAIEGMFERSPELARHPWVMGAVFADRRCAGELQPVREFIANSWTADELVAEALKYRDQIPAVRESQGVAWNDAEYYAVNCLAPLAIKLSDPRWQREFRYSNELEELLLQFFAYKSLHAVIAEMPVAFEEPFRRKLDSIKEGGELGVWVEAMVLRTQRLTLAEKKSKAIAIQGSAQNFLRLCLQKVEVRYQELPEKALALLVNAGVDYGQDTNKVVSEMARRLSDPKTIGRVTGVLHEITSRSGCIEGGKKFGGASIRLCPALQPIAPKLWEIANSVEYWADQDRSWIASQALYALACGGLLPDKVIPALFGWSYRYNIDADEKTSDRWSQCAKHALGYYAALGFKVAVV